MTAPIEIEYDRETDGRWIAEAPAFPGAMAYGDTQAEARERVLAIVNEYDDFDSRPTLPYIPVEYEIEPPTPEPACPPTRS